MADEKWTQVKEIFDAVLQRKPDERAAFLDEACNGNDTVRLEVESLLSSFGRAEGFMQMPVIEGSSEEPTIMKEALAAGDRIGHYEIIELLGVGGMGEVYLAQDVNLNRKAAVKIFSEEMAAKGTHLERFVREAQSASALNHPHICTIYEVNREHDPPFIAMEYIEGETLSAKIVNGKVDAATAINIALQIADGLAEAHDAGIVHRDIKPANIIVNKRGQVKIVDFGLAKKVTAAADERTQRKLSVSGLILGTVSYMSPEQARGQPVDSRTDIWSLGVVLYQMVTGKLPFEGDTTGDVIASILRSEPASMAVDGQIPPELTGLLHKALAKEKESRYSSARHLAADLHKAKSALSRSDRSSDGRDQTTVAFAQPTRKDAAVETISERGSGFLRRNLRRFAVFFVLAAAAGLGVSYYKYFGTGPAPIESIAVMPFENETGSADTEYLSDGLTESLIGRLSTLPGISVKARSSVFRYKGKNPEPRAIASDLGVQAVLNGRIVNRANDFTLYVELVDATTENVLWKREYDRPTANLMSVQSEIVRDVLENLKVKLSVAEVQNATRNYTENAEAYQLYLKGRYYWDKRNEDAYKVAVDAYEQAIALDPNYALAYAGLADCYLFREVGVSRKVAMPKAKEYALKALEMDETLAEAHTTLAFVTMNYELNFPEGEKEFKRAIELKPNYAIAHQFYGTMLVATGRTEDGLAEMRKAVDLEPYSATINWSLGLGLTFARRYDEALAQVERSLQIHPDHPLLEGQLAGLYTHQGRYDEALAITQKRLGISERNLNSRSALAKIYVKTGKSAEAREILKGLIDDPQQKANTPYMIASVYAELGENDEAMLWVNKAYEERAFSLFFLRVDPVFDSLHSDPRFEELVRRIGLYAE